MDDSLIFFCYKTQISTITDVRTKCIYVISLNCNKSIICLIFFYAGFKIVFGTIHYWIGLFKYRNRNQTKKNPECSLDLSAVVKTTWSSVTDDWFLTEHINIDYLLSQVLRAGGYVRTGRSVRGEFIETVFIIILFFLPTFTLPVVVVLWSLLLLRRWRLL